MSPRRWAPWSDRQGRFAPANSAMLAAAVLPALWLAWRAATGALTILPLAPLIYDTGLVCIALLLAALAITPARRIFGLARLILARRIAGVAAFAYALAHAVVYGLLRNLDLGLIGREVTTRATLVIALLATAGLAALAATSSDRAIRRLGSRWARLHRLVYPATALAILHFMLSPGSVGGPSYVMAGLFAWLMGWRMLDHGTSGRHPRALLGLTMAAAVTTALLEAVMVQVFHGFPMARTLAADFSLAFGLAPAWTVLGAGLLVSGVRVAQLAMSRE